MQHEIEFGVDASSRSLEEIVKIINGFRRGKLVEIQFLDEPRQSAWFSRLNRLRQTLNLEAVPDETDFEEFDCITASWNHLLGGDLRNTQKHEQFFADMRNALVGDDHKQFCHAVRNLFRLLGWDAEIREKQQGETDVIAMVSVDGKHYLLVVEGKPEMENGKPMPLRYVNQANGQLTRYKSDSRFAKHEVAAIMVSKADILEDSASPAAGNLTLVRQTALLAAADIAIAAFQRYAAITALNK